MRLWAWDFAKAPSVGAFNGGRTTFQFARLSSGESGEATVQIVSERMAVLCPLPDHAQLGEIGEIRVEER